MSHAAQPAQPAPPAPAPSVGPIAIIGAGRVGLVLARLSRAAGIDVTVAGSGDPARIAAAVAQAAPGASVATARDAASAAGVVILAIPLPAFRSLPAEHLEAKLVIDAMNYWWETDGHLPEFADPLTSTSETVQAHLATARVVKALNHASLWELENLARPAGDRERRALAIAGDNPDDVATASALIDALGFDPVPAGPLANGVKFEPGTEIFGADASAGQVRTMLDRFWTSQRGLVVARARAHPSESGPSSSA